MSIRAFSYRTVLDIYLTLKGVRYPQTLQFLEKSQWWSAEQIKKFQNNHVHKLIEYVYKYVPYYHNIMKERGIKPSHIENSEDLVKLPVLSKDMFRDHWKEMISSEKKVFRTSTRRTGGTTGEPLQIKIDYSNSAWESAAYTRGLGFAGFQNGETIVMLFGGTLGLAPESFLEKLKSKFAGIFFLPAFEISADTLQDYVRTIEKSKARFLCGYTSAIYLLGKLMDDENITIPLKGVFPTAETLYDYQRETINKVFKCNVFNIYGCGEINSVAFECQNHTLHITDENVLLEALTKERRVPDGEMGALTVTTLHNYYMPLIRYQNGDIISIDKGNCSCGRGLNSICKLYGRSNDLMLARDGRLISGAFIPHLFRTTNGIRELQVIQESEDSILLKIVKNDKTSEEELLSRISVIQKYLGKIEVRIRYVSSIPRTPKGKLVSVISKFGDNLLGK